MQSNVKLKTKDGKVYLNWQGPDDSARSIVADLHLEFDHSMEEEDGGYNYFEKKWTLRILVSSRFFFASKH